MLRSSSRLGLCLGLALLAGCPAEDGSPDLAPRIAPSVQVTADVVGFATRLDASGSSDAEARALSFAWEVVTVPAGSEVTTATLSARSGAQVSFEPDLGGDYQVRLIAQAGEESAERVVMFTVPTVPLFFYQGSGLSAQQLGVGIMRSDGTGKRLLSCAIKALSPDGGTPSDLYGSLRFSGLFGLRAWEPKSMGAPWRVTFLEVVPTPDGTQAEEFRLWAGDENSGCDTEPARRIDSTGFTNDHRHFYPRFSPDGSRVLYVDEPQDASAFTFRLMSIAIDRSQQRQIRSGMPQLKGVPPAWYDATHVVWVEDISANTTPHLVVYKATDGNAAGDPGGDRTVLLDCGGVLNVINQIEVIDGDVVISGGERSSIGFGNPNPGALELYRMKPGACTLASKIAPEPVRGMAWDFAVSPDGKNIVYMATFGPGGTKTTNDLWIVPSNGSAPPRYFAGNAKYFDFGPRWVAGGRQIVWTQAADGEPARGGGLMIANADGSHQRSLYRENILGRVIGGSNQGTSCAYGGAPRAVELLFGLVLLATACRILWRLRRGDPRRTTGNRTE